MKLNVYIAESGYCSRRKAVELIKDGKVTVNHFPVTEPGYEVKKKDTIRVGKKVVEPEEKIYLLFNKPSGCVTTTKDEHGRPTVLDFIKIKERVFPVGRLDFDTTGLLLLTNDGQLGQKLAHPSFEVEKTYNVILDKPLEHKDLLKIQKGIRLNDGKVKVDALSYVGNTKKGVAVTIHTGKYRIIRRIFEHLGYTVEKLDRASYAGLRKKGLQKGKWRELTGKEVEALKNKM